MSHTHFDGISDKPVMNLWQQHPSMKMAQLLHNKSLWYDSIRLGDTG